MRQILDHKTRTDTYTDDERGEVQREVVESVSYIDHVGALHELHFYPVGTNVAGEAEEEPRVVGDTVPHYTFTTPEEAVDAYENGKVI